MIRVGQQSLLRQRDDFVYVAEAAVQLHEDIAEDVLLLPAAAAHAVDLRHGRGHEPERGVEIALDELHLAFEQRRP